MRDRWRLSVFGTPARWATQVPTKYNTFGWDGGAFLIPRGHHRSPRIPGSGHGLHNGHGPGGRGAPRKGVWSRLERSPALTFGGIWPIIADSKRISE